MPRLIDADALSDWLKDYGQKYIKGDREISLMYIWKHIQDMPTIEPERKMGKWKRRLVDSGFNADWHCSECGWKTALEEHGYNFCPNCGADMRGEQDE